MKKTYLILLAAAALASCAKGYQDKGPDSSRKNAVSFAGVTQDDDRTRVSYKEDAGAIRLAWQTTDQIGIYGFCNDASIAANIAYKAQQAASSSSFESVSDTDFVEWQDEVSLHDFYAYYPYSENAGDNISEIGISVPAAQTQSGAGSMAHIAKYDFMYAACKNVVKTRGLIRLPFNHLFSVMAVSLTAAEGTEARVSSLTFSCTDPNEALAFDGTADLKTGALTVTPASKSNSVTLTFSSPLTVRQTPVNAYILISPGHKGKSFEIKATVDGTETGVLWTKPVPGDGIPAGVKTTIPIKVDGTLVDPNAVIDLSADGTANTYLVNGAGRKYKFKATVKGNGVDRTFTWDGEDHVYNKAYSAAIDGAADAKLLWWNTPQDGTSWSDACPVEIKSVELKDGYVHFSTPDNFVGGNAAIAVFDRAVTHENMNGAQILWSWNIWAVEDYNTEATARRVGGYTMMDRNLGAIAGPEAKIETDAWKAAWASGQYYQWGRKDPLPAMANNSDSNIAKGGESAMRWGIPTYTPFLELQKDMSSKSWGADNILYTDNLDDNSCPLESLYGIDFTLEDALEATTKYPYKWVSSTTSGYMRTYPHLWLRKNERVTNLSERFDWIYLWGNHEYSGGKKTIYDPCPPGWKVPDPEALALALGDGIEVAPNKLGLWSEKFGLYFPLTGQRMAYWNEIAEVAPNASGNFNVLLQTASAGTQQYVITGDRSGNANLNSVSGPAISGRWQGAAYQLRCVKEETSFVTVSKPKTGPAAAVAGNSITRMFNERPFFVENNYIASAWDGRATIDIMYNFYDGVIARDPQCVVIAGGTNDICAVNGNGADYGYMPYQRIFANIKIMAEWVAQYGIPVVLASVHPMTTAPWNSVEWNAEYGPKNAARIIELNKMLKAYAEERGFIYLDYHSAMKNPDNTPSNLYYYDGVHPRAEGFTVMEPLLKAAVDKALRIPGQIDTGSDQLKDLDKWDEWAE